MVMFFLLIHHMKCFLCPGSHVCIGLTTNWIAWNTGCQAKAPRHLFVNKVLLEHNRPHLFTYFLWLVSCFSGSVECLSQRPYGLQSLTYLLSDAFQKKLSNLWSKVQDLDEEDWKHGKRSSRGTWDVQAKRRCRCDRESGLQIIETLLFGRKIGPLSV